MKNQIRLAKVLLLEHNGHVLMHRLSHIADPESCRRLDLPVWNSVVKLVLLIVQRWVRLRILLLLLVFALGVQAVEKHQVTCQNHLL
jgi:hypothetical protein